MKNKTVDERLNSLLDLEQDATLDAVFEAVRKLKRELSDANDTAGDLSQALSVIEGSLGIPTNAETSPDPSLEAIGALKDERRAYELSCRQLVEALDLDEETEIEAVLEEIGRLRDDRVRGEENGRRLREAAGLDPHAPPDRLIAVIRAAREEAVALRRMLALQADASSDVVFDSVDKLKRRASDMEVSGQERRELRGHLTRIAVELGLPQPGAVAEIFEAIRALKPKREAGMSNGAWLAQAWEVLTQHLHLPPGASLEDALSVIDEAIDIRDRVLQQFDLFDVDINDPLGPAVEHRIHAQRAAAQEVGSRLAQKEAQLDELRDLHARYCVAAKIDPAYPPLSVQDALATLRERRDELLSFAQMLRIALDLESSASLEEVYDAVRELQVEASQVADYDLLIERASAVSDLVVALTSANARLAASFSEGSR